MADVRDEIDELVEWQMKQGRRREAATGTILDPLIPLIAMTVGAVEALLPIVQLAAESPRRGIGQLRREVADMVRRVRGLWQVLAQRRDRQ